MSNRKFSPCFTPEQVGERLRTIRKRLDLTQKEFAEALMIDIKSYSKYETGVTYPKVETLSRIAEMAGISVDFLIGRTNDSTQLYSQLDMLGLSEKAAEQLRMISENPNRYYRESLNLILENDDIRVVLDFVAHAISCLFCGFWYEDATGLQVEINRDDIYRKDAIAVKQLESKGFQVYSPRKSAEIDIMLATDVFKNILQTTFTKAPSNGACEDYEEKIWELLSRLPSVFEGIKDANH